MLSTSRKLIPSMALLVPRDIPAALAALGIDAEVRGDEAKALCPHPDHDDTSPSWSCNLDDGRHHCFSCGYGGSFTLLAANMLGITRMQAVQWVRDRKIRDVADGFVGPRVRVQPRAPSVSEADMWNFTEPPDEALASRGLTAEACQRFDVRWDHDKQLWITPVREPYTGRLWGWQAKNDKIFLNHPRHLVKSKTLYGFDLVPPGGTVVLVESPLDVPYAYPACVRECVHPVSSYGASVSADQIALLRDRAGQIILAMDNDRAGWKSVSALAFAFGTLPVLVFAYPGTVAPDGSVGETDGRDPGNLSMDELSYGLSHAVPAWRFRRV